MKFLLDQGIPRDAGAELREMSYECVHVSEIGMWSAPDTEILRCAAEQGATVVTLDADFHAILAISGASKPSVIRIRMKSMDAVRTVQAIRTAMAAFHTELQRGALVTVKQRKTTCHQLPIGGPA